MKNKIKYFIIPAIVCLLLSTPAISQIETDNNIYSSLLSQHVHNGRVDYDGFKKDEARLDEYLAVLSATDARSLSRNQQFAFYINAYNAFTIKLVLSEYPGINSIKEIGNFFSGPWSKKFIKLKQGKVSLDHIEHNILRPVFKDPRVHFAINCASKGCPPLLEKPYEGEILDSQLDQQARSFINNPKRNRVKGDTLFISKIFKWFKEDFSDNPLRFIQTYAGRDLKSDIQSAGASIKISYLEYDWTLNR